MRPSERTPNQIRPVTFTRNYTMHAEGSVLVGFGNTKVLCTATVEAGVPRFMKGQGKGWVTAEYGGRLRVLAPLGFGNDVIAPLLGEYNRTYSSSPWENQD